MPNSIRNARTVRFEPWGLVDAIDGTRSPPGAMWLLQNLVPSPNMDRVSVPRPAAVEQTNFPGFTAPTGATALTTVGNIAYGFLSSGTFAGKDEPFAYNMATGVFLPISGQASGNLPATQPTTGDWTPPTVQQVGSRVVFTHPGFAGNGGGVVPFYAELICNTTNASPTITTAPMTGLQIGGRLFANSNIGAGAKINAVVQNTVQTTGSGMTGTPTLTVGSATGLFIGMLVTLADGSVSGLYITGIAGTTITLSGNLTGSPSGVAAFFYGTTITASVNSTGTATSVTVFAMGGGEAVNFGWLDMTGVSQAGLANIVGSPVPVLTGNFPISAGIQPGMKVTGSGIPAGATVAATQNVVIDAPFCTTTTGNPKILMVATSALIEGGFGPAVGQIAAGSGIPTGAQVLAVDYTAWPIVTLTISQNATTSSSVAAITLTGSIIVLSSAPSGSAATNVAITIAGGSTAAPLWGAGDTTLTPLAARPVSVSQYNGRAWYGLNPANAQPGVTFSDSGLACQQSSTVTQTLTFADGIPVTATAGQQLDNQLGGIVQSLIVFQGDGNMRQITGDITTGNLSQNSLTVATGTIAPRSIASTPLGLMFVSSDGLRYLDFNGNLQGPVGTRGKGLCLPFINAVTPTRAAATFNENVYRVSLTWQPPAVAAVQWGTAQRIDEFWFHLDLGAWSGPHTLPASAIAPWPAQNSFIAVPVSDPDSLFRSDPVPTSASGYVENGTRLTWEWETAYLPDNPNGMACAVSEGTMFFQLPTADQALVTVTDDEGTQLDEFYIWQGPQTTPAQRALMQTKPWVFRQMGVAIAGNSSASVQLGAVSLNYEELGYRWTVQTGPPFIVGTSPVGGGDVARP